MRLLTTTSLVSVVPVSDFAVALAWYERLLGAPDEIPMESMAEWRIAPDAWLQIDGTGAGAAGHAAVVVGVEDVTAAHRALQQAGIAVGGIEDYGVVQVCALHDPDGNRLSLAQTMAPAAA